LIRNRKSFQTFMPIKSVKIKTIFFIYWFLLLYIIAALIWWFIALYQQNERMSDNKIHLLSLNGYENAKQLETIEQDRLRKRGQYIGEGSIFLLIISAGAIFLYRAVNKQLKLTRQQQDFMMAVTHELKTPLAVTRLNLETLQKRKLDDLQQARLIGNTLQESNRMNALCNNLLLSSQMEANGYKFTPEKINISELVGSCLSDFQSRFPHRQINAELEDSIVLHADAFLLQMAINNLLDNAIKYSSKETTIKVVLKNNNQAVCLLSISDEGKGISNENKQRIFEKYYRVGTEATQKSKGTGLGLFLVDRIIKAHHAKISVENNLPKGTVFIIELKK